GGPKPGRGAECKDSNCGARPRACRVETPLNASMSESEFVPTGISVEKNLDAARTSARATDHRLASTLAGAGSSGGRSCDFCFFSISISEISRAGETAETGTLPDSAPQ